MRLSSLALAAPFLLGFAAAARAARSLPLSARPPTADADALRHFRAVVSRARSESVPDEEERLPLTPWYVTGTLLFNLAAHLVATGEVCTVLNMHSPSLYPLGVAGGGSLGLAQVLVWGVPGAFSMAAVELWRCGDDCAVPEDDADCPRCSALVSPLLIGTAPVAAVSRVLLNEAGVGERVVRVVQQSSDGARQASTVALAAGGALASCAWAQGVVQTYLQTWLRQAAAAAATACFDAAQASSSAEAISNSAATLLTVRAALAPAAAVLVTATLVVAFETATASVLQPEAVARARATEEALEAAREKAGLFFALEAPPEEARRRAVAFEAEAKRWKLAREEAARRDTVASALRATVAASVFAASGGCLLAPVVAGLGVAFDPLPLWDRARGQWEGLSAHPTPPVEWAAYFSLCAVACGCASVLW